MSIRELKGTNDMKKILALFTIALISIWSGGCEKSLTTVSEPEYNIAAIPDVTGDLYLFNPKGKRIRMIASGIVSQPTWSPVSAELAYAVQTDLVSNRWDLYITDVNSGKKLLLANDDGFKYRPRFSPDGSKIAYFNTNQTIDRRDLYIVNSNGSNKEILLTEAEGEYCTHLDWTYIKDHLLIYKKARNDTTGIGRLYLINVLDKSQEYLADITSQALRTIDGRQWIYWQRDAGGNALSILDLNDRSKRKIISNGRYGFSGYAWHPDGQTIVFSMDDSLSNRRGVYQVDSNGENLIRLVLWEEQNCTQPRFFPDGQRILYQSSFIPYFQRDHYILNLATGEISNLTADTMFGDAVMTISTVRL